MTAASTSTLELADLHGCVENLREQVAACVLPLDLPGARQAQTGRLQLLHQLDDYVLPRLASIDAPLLAVVGGSTGAGKSTLVNSLVGAVVSRPGVLRPTTRSPVLVHHPADEALVHRRPGPAGAGPGHRGRPGETRTRHRAPRRLDALPPGLALLDAPDIDSVVRSNRDLADQLLSAADLWLFVTTAARYADAVPWELLRQAAERGTSVASCSTASHRRRSRRSAPHLASMLREQGLAGRRCSPSPRPRSARTGCSARTSRAAALVAPGAGPRRAGPGDRRAPDPHRRPRLAGPAHRRPSSTPAAAQHEAPRRSCPAADTAYAEAADAVDAGMTDGTLLRGEVLARWQEFVGTGEFFRQVESGVGRAPRPARRPVKGKPAAGARPRRGAAERGGRAADRARRRAAASAMRAPGGGCPAARSCSLPTPTSPQPSADLARAGRAARARLAGRRARPGPHRGQGPAHDRPGRGIRGQRDRASCSCSSPSASTAGLTGAEVGIAGGTALLGQRLLEAIFGDQAVRDAGGQGPARLLERGSELYADEPEPVPDAVESGGAAPTRPSASRRGGAAWRRRGEPVADGRHAGRDGVGRARPRPQAAALAAALDAGGERAGRRPRSRPRAGSSRRSRSAPRSSGATPSSRWPAPPAAASPRCSTRWSARRSRPSGRGGPRRRPRPRRSGGASRPASCSTGSAWRPGTSSMTPLDGSRREGAWARLDGLVLLDLPDFDSRESRPPDRGRAGARARRRVRLGDRPAEVRRRPAARRLRRRARTGTRP